MDLEQIRRAARWNILVQQGSSWQRTLRFDVDISRVLYRGQIRQSHADAAVLAAFTFLKLDAHTVTMALTPSDTAALPTEERCVYDVEIHDVTNSIVVRILEGFVTVTPEVTR